MTTATNFEWITPVDEYVLRQTENAGSLKITWKNTDKAQAGKAYMPLPLGNLNIVATWEGSGSAQLYYLPDGSYDSRQKIAEFSEDTAYKQRVKHIPLAIDNPDAKLYVTAASGQSRYTCGVKIIKTTIDFKEQEE